MLYIMIQSAFSSITGGFAYGAQDVLAFPPYFFYHADFDIIAYIESNHAANDIFKPKVFKLHGKFHLSSKWVVWYNTHNRG